VKLRIATPTGLALETDDVRHVRAEDATGAFGIQPGHTEFITRLAVSVLTWRDARGAEHPVAVRGGVLRVRDGRMVQVATREAVVGEPLDELRRAVLGRMRDASEAEARARTRATQLQVSIVRHLYRYVRAERGRGPLRFDGGEDGEPASSAPPSAHEDGT
jgi:F-type H+-transporting ATPase subunit epsilon